MSLDRERHHDRVRRRVLPPLEGDLDRGRLRPAGRRPRDPGQAGEVHPGLRRQRANDGRLLRPATRRGQVRLQLGACTKDVDLGWYTLPKGSLGGNDINTRAWWTVCRGSDAPRVADDAAHRPALGYQGLLHHQDQGRPVIYNKHMVFPKPGVDLSDPANFASIGMTITGSPP